MANAMTITSTFTYTACEFPTAVAKIFSITRYPDNKGSLSHSVLIEQITYVFFAVQNLTS